MPDKKQYPDSVQIQINRKQIENIVKRTIRNETKIEDYRSDFSEFRNALIIGLLGVIGILITAIITLLTIL